MGISILNAAQTRKSFLWKDSEESFQAKNKFLWWTQAAPLEQMQKIQSPWKRLVATGGEDDVYENSLHFPTKVRCLQSQTH